MLWQRVVFYMSYERSYLAFSVIVLSEIGELLQY